MNFNKEKKNQESRRREMLPWRDVTNARDVTIDVDTCRHRRQAGRQKKGYATQHQNQTAERIIINNNNNITDSLSKIQILQRFFAPV